MGCIGKVGSSGEKCGEFYVNDNRDGIYCGEFDSVDLVVGSRERCREKLGKRGGVVKNVSYKL